MDAELVLAFSMELHGDAAVMLTLMDVDGTALHGFGLGDEHALNGSTSSGA